MIFTRRLVPWRDLTFQKALRGDYAAQEYSGALDLDAAIASATPEVRAAYAEMRRPPRYQLYDLQADPYEFRNLADDTKHSGILADLKTRLTQWRIATNVPLMDADKLKPLTAEVRSVKKKSAAKKRPWEYPEYLFHD